MGTERKPGAGKRKRESRPARRARLAAEEAAAAAEVAASRTDRLGEGMARTLINEAIRTLSFAQRRREVLERLLAAGEKAGDTKLVLQVARVSPAREAALLARLAVRLSGELAASERELDLEPEDHLGPVLGRVRAERERLGLGAVEGGGAGGEEA